MDYEKLMAAARKTNARRDEIDKRNGFVTPYECGADGLLKTIREAIECGIRAGDWNIVAEGQAMLEKMIEIVGAK